MQEIGKSIKLNGERGESMTSSGNRTRLVDKDTQKTNERSNPSDCPDRFFTDTLNPRVLQL